MSKINISALSTDHAFASQIQEALSGTFETLELISKPSPCDLLLVVTGENWSKDISNDPQQYDAVTEMLHRQDVPIVVILPEDTEPPKLADLPEELHGIIYMKRLHIHMDESRYKADLIRLAKAIDAHVHRHKTSAGGFPVNLVLFAAIILFGFFIILLPEDTEETPVNGRNVGQSVQIGIAVSLNPDTIAQSDTMINGLTLALQEKPSVVINNISYPIDLVTLDTNCTSLGAIRTAESFTSDPDILAILGPLCDVSCTASASIYDEAGYAVISPTCDSASLSTFSTFNRTVPSQTSVAIAAAEYVQDVENVLIIHDEQVAALDLVTAFQIAYSGEAQVIPINTNQFDINIIMRSVDALAPEVIYFAGRATTAAELRARLSEDVTFILAMPDDEYITLAGDAASNTLAFEIALPEIDSTHYIEVFSSEPSSIMYAYSYDAMNILIAAIESAATTDKDDNIIVNRQALNDAIRAYNGIGLTGELNCNNTGECAAQNTRLISVQDGAWTDGLNN